MTYTIKTINYKIAEKLIHQRLRQYKIKCKTSREFFGIDINEAVDVINEIVHMVNNPLIINTNE
jgi:hypothetical protein